ncbi:MAG TPA: ammonia-forming cytochrome c nitrite reductase subunit c552 [Verrucomicrobiales bacterium]|nr:ammonia-forming cytochrome c nitrite reductase subunit c552 [Verrucomicrobiales bacterium]
MSSRKRKNRPPSDSTKKTVSSEEGKSGLPIWIRIVIALGICTGIYFLIRSEPKNELSKRNITASNDEQQPLSEETIFATYAGSESCRECHTEAYDFWKTSNHGLAERDMDSAMDQSAFGVKTEFTIASVSSEAYQSGDDFILKTLGFDGKNEAYKLQGVIGETPLRQYLVESERGRIQALDTAFAPQESEWFNVYGEEDRYPGEWGHWTGRGMNWNSMCASCHNTRLRKNYITETDTYRTTMAERSVGCEACHGPMKNHVDWQHEYKDSQETDPTLQKFSPDRILDTCGSCHARRGELTGDFKPGDNFFDHYSLVIPNETELYYADGQIHEEDYVMTSFLSSGMHSKGVRCLDCHQPHSTKTILSGNLLCMRCHSGGLPEFPTSPIINPATHTFHTLNQPGSHCVDCHMPQTTYMQKHPRRDHGFTIPDPYLTKRYGIPNACNRCHTDKSIEWALEKTEAWYGEKMNRPTRHRAIRIAEARTADSAAREETLKMLSEEERPFWKAVAADLLDPWVYDPIVSRALLKYVNHPDPLLRQTVVRTLEPLVGQTDQPFVRPALQKLLKDPIRSVRISAAWNLRNEINPDSIAGRDLNRFLEYHMDQPSGRHQMGIYHLAQGNAEQALLNLRQAVEWDEFSPALRHEYAIVLSMAGDHREALTQLQHAARLDPSEAEFFYKIGLGWNELNEIKQTIKALQKAVEINPQHDRAWYNLGLALNATNEPEEAISALIRAESVNSQNPRIPYARATILYRLGRMEETRNAADRALEIEPNYGEALNLIRSLQR